MEAQKKEQIDVGFVVHKVFKECDEGSKGYLTRTDLKVAMVSLLGYKPCKFEVEELMGNAKVGLSKEAFTAAMAKKMTTVDKDEEIREIFTAFDRQSKGFLTIDDLHHAASRVTARFPSHVLNKAFQELDGDRDGRISFRDFEFMMKFIAEDDL